MEIGLRRWPLLPFAELDRALADELGPLEPARRGPFERALDGSVPAQLLAKHHRVLDGHRGALSQMRRGGMHRVAD